MANPFAITADSNTVFLDEGRQAQTAFTVTNLSGRPLRARARLLVQDPTAATWLRLGGEAERDLPAGVAQQYAVQIKVPPTAAAGSYPFRLDISGVENPDELLVQGPTVTFNVIAPQAKNYAPVWIPMAAVAIILLVLVIAGVGFNLVGNQGAASATVAVQSQGTQTALALANAATEQAAANATAAAAPADCGSVAIANNGLPQDASALSNESCFQLAFESCRPAVLTVTQHGVDTSSIIRLETHKQGTRCSVLATIQSTVLPQPPRTTTVECRGESSQADGLHITNCGGQKDIIVPAPK